MVRNAPSLGKATMRSNSLITSGTLGMSDTSISGTIGGRPASMSAYDTSFDVEHLPAFLACNDLLKSLLKFKEPKNIEYNSLLRGFNLRSRHNHGLIEKTHVPKFK